MAVSRIDFRGADSLVGDAQSAPTPPRKAEESNLSSDAPTQCLDHQLQCNISLIQPMTPNQALERTAARRHLHFR